MEDLPNCPKCDCEYTYEDMELIICPECAYEFRAEDLQEKELTVKDANGTTLKTGDDVTVIKDLKLKGSSTVIKVGTKIKGIRIVESSDDHNIDCKISGVGALKIKQIFVKKI